MFISGQEKENLLNRIVHLEARVDRDTQNGEDLWRRVSLHRGDFQILLKYLGPQLIESPPRQIVKTSSKR